MAERRKFYRQLEVYRTEMQTYRTQRPMEELRLKLLREAGERRCMQPSPHTWVDTGMHSVVHLQCGAEAPTAFAAVPYHTIRG